MKDLPVIRIYSSAEGIRILRGAVLGISQRAFARRLGRTQSYVSKIETGRVPISDRSLERLEAIAPRSWFLPILSEVENERKKLARR